MGRFCIEAKPNYRELAKQYKLFFNQKTAKGTREIIGGWSVCLLLSVRFSA